MLIHEDDLIKLFQGVSNTHVFRHWQKLAKTDLEELAILLEKEWQTLTADDLDEPINTMSFHKGILIHLIEKFGKRNPYANTLQSDVISSQKEDELHTYHELYSYYITQLSIFSRENFIHIWRWSFNNPMNCIIGFLSLHQVYLNDKFAMETDEIEGNFKEISSSVIKVQALLDATADYEKELFG